MRKSIKILYPVQYTTLKKEELYKNYFVVSNPDVPKIYGLPEIHKPDNKTRPRFKYFRTVFYFGKLAGEKVEELRGSRLCISDKFLGVFRQSQQYHF